MTERDNPSIDVDVDIHGRRWAGYGVPNGPPSPGLPWTPDGATIVSVCVRAKNPQVPSWTPGQWIWTVALSHGGHRPPATEPNVRDKLGLTGAASRSTPPVQRLFAPHVLYPVFAVACAMRSASETGTGRHVTGLRESSTQPLSCQPNPSPKPHAPGFHGLVSAHGTPRTARTRDVYTGMLTGVQTDWLERGASQILVITQSGTSGSVVRVLEAEKDGEDVTRPAMKKE